MKYIKLFIIACCLSAGISDLSKAQTGNPTTSGKFVLKNDAGNAITLAVPSGAFTPYTLTLPATLGQIGELLYLSNNTQNFSWLPAGTNGQVLAINGSGLPTWTTLTVGSVSSVGLAMPSIFTVTNSPVTSSGTLTAALNTQSATFVFAGPVSGAAAIPTFRALVGTDLPPGSGNYIQNGTSVQASSNYNISGNGTIGGQLQLKGSTSGTTTFQASASGANLNYTLPATAPANGQVLSSTSAGVMSWANASAGSVTSVGLAMPSIFTVTNSPVTSTGTLTATLNAQNANLFFAGPTSGAATVPTFRALSPTDVPALPYVSSVGLSMPSIFTVTNSPVTSSGTLTTALNTQSAAFVFAGPVSGAAATPTFRALVGTDLPPGSANYIQNGITVQSSANYNISGNGAIGGQLQLKGSTSGTTTFQASASGANLNYTVPSTAPTANQVLISNGGATSNLSWTDAGSLLSGSYWSVTGNNTASAWNGAAGNFLGTTSTQPLVLATTNTTTPQPIELFTNNTERMRIGGDGNVGISVTTPNTKLDVDGALSLRPTIPASLNSNTTITVGNRSYIRITHGAIAATYTISLSNGLQDGQTLIIQCESIDGTHPFQFTDGGNLTLSGNFIPNTNHSTICLIWDGSSWVETARSLN